MTATYEKIIKYIDDNISEEIFAYCLRGVTYYELGETEKSEEEFDNSIKFAKDLAQAYGQRAAMYCHHVKQPEKAIEDYTKAIELDPNRTCLYSNRASCYTRMKQPEKAIEYFNKALELDPDLKEARECLDRILRNKN